MEKPLHNIVKSFTKEQRLAFLFEVFSNVCEKDEIHSLQEKLFTCSTNNLTIQPMEIQQEQEQHEIADNDEDIIALDIIFVQKKKKKKNNNKKIKKMDNTLQEETILDTDEIATISIVSKNLNILMNEKVFHEPDTFILKPKFGFDRLTFVNGSNRKDVLNRMFKLIENKMVITYGGGDYFKLLHDAEQQIEELLRLGIFKHFDLKDHFESKNRELNELKKFAGLRAAAATEAEMSSLKTLSNKYVFLNLSNKNDFEKETSLKNAINIMKIFRKKIFNQ